MMGYPRRTLASYQAEFPDITVISGDSNALLVQCSQGHEWVVTAGDLRKGQRCGACAWNGPRTLDSYQAEFPDIAVLSGHSEALLVKCSQGHEWTAPAGNLRKGKRCSACAWNGPRTLDSYQEEFPDITVISGHSKALLVQCSKDHEWVVTAGTLRQGKRCGICCPYGFSPDKPSWMYLLHFAANDTLKVGITNRNPFNDDGTYAGRLAEHNDGNMRVLDIVGAADGHQIQADETTVRRFLRANDLNIPPSYEYWQRDEFPVDKIATLISITNQGDTQ